MSGESIHVAAPKSDTSTRPPFPETDRRKRAAAIPPARNIAEV
jgi:hypothetical protein